MLAFALLIGIYSYGIFTLGVLDVLTKTNCILLTVIWFILLVFFERKSFTNSLKKFSLLHLSKITHEKQIFLLIALFILQLAVNLTGALGPELAFDALWYHLTLPKLYLLHHAIYHIPGGLLYYSDMPKLGEMLYVGALAIGNEIVAKVIHYLFGILTAIALYKLSRKFFTKFVSFLIVVVFYSNLVVDTESITAYIDLIRTFFEVMVLWQFFDWLESQKWKSFVLSAIMMGLAITTKVLAIESLITILTLLMIISFSPSFNKNLKNSQLFFKNKFALVPIALFFYSFIALVIPLPWFIFSFIHTGNPVYPFFTQRYEVNLTQFGFFQFLSSLWNLFMHSPDPISPLYMIFFPLIFVFYSQFQKEIKLIVYYCGLSLIIWYFTPQTGGGRFILPYLPAFSLLCGAIYSQILKNTRIEWKYVSRILFVTIIFVFSVSIVYRFIANSKYIPVIIGKESKQTFLTNNLDFSFGDFYDTDGYFAHHIKSSDTVLLYGFHNLYYVDFPFIDSSWVKKRYKFDYIAVQKTKLPLQFKNWQLIYFNDKTMVQLYKPPKGQCQKTCYY